MPFCGSADLGVRVEARSRTQQDSKGRETERPAILAVRHAGYQASERAAIFLLIPEFREQKKKTKSTGNGR